MSFHVFPLISDSKRPAVEDWERAARPMSWHQLDSSKPLGLACGPSGLVVIDCDVDKRSGEPYGWSQLLWLFEQRDSFPTSLQVRTPSGGTHVYYWAPEDVELRNSTKKLAGNIDTRASGGYVVTPRTCIEGKIYQAYGSPRDIEPLPDWLTALLKRPEPPPIPPGGLRGEFGKGYAEAALRNEVQDLLATQEGSRNHRLNVAAYNLGQLIAVGQLDVERVTEVLWAAARQIGLAERETRLTIASGLRNGALAPRAR